MISVLQHLLTPLKTPQQKLNRLREYTQALLLKMIEKHGDMKNLVFVGGTALRIVYGISRYSEDLDFSWIGSHPLQFKSIVSFLERELRLAGFEVIFTSKETRIVHSCFIKFSGLLYALGLSTTKSRHFSVKLEIDTNPPQRYVLQTSNINQDFFFQTQHHDLSTLCAGKCCAILCRPYAKGRDFYDLLWLMAKKIHPNYRFLSEAYTQITQKKILFNHELLKDKLTIKLREVDFKKIHSDVLPFLMDPDELKYLTADSLIELTAQWLTPS